MTPKARWWIDRILSCVYPDVCQVCHKHRAPRATGYVCGACSSRIRPVHTPFCQRCGLPFEGELSTVFECANCRELDLHFDFARSAVLARGPVLEIIHRYKYRHASWFESFLADLLVRRAAPSLRQAGWDLIVPVPLHTLRERERMFNQAQRLAKHLGHATGIAVRSRCLRRTRATGTQTRLSRGQRARNVARAFSLRPGADVRGASCVVVDDVLTTGATTSGCARALKAGGARHVCVWTVARGV